MSSLGLSLGQASIAGRKSRNQDFHGAMVPRGSALAIKGAVLALADGISTSDVSAMAAETAVKALMTDYYATPETWSPQTSAARVISATNGWLYAQTRAAHGGDRERGLVCALAALILRGQTAHILHLGDARVWRLSGGRLEPLTADHSALHGGSMVLTRAMGLDAHADIDHRQEVLRKGDIFLLTSDGVHEHWSPARITALLTPNADLEAAAAQILAEAFAAGSPDNLTLQIVRIDSLPRDGESLRATADLLPLPPALTEGGRIDGLTLIRQVHVSHRSRLFLAQDATGARVALKLPTADLAADPQALRRLMTEVWIARRLSHPRLLGAPEAPGRSALYTVTNWVDGQTLRQWHHDKGRPDLTQWRDIAGQIASGLTALHRRQMLHQDLRPENVMIDDQGRITLIDFGAAHVAGLQEGLPGDDILGTAQYTAPEYFTGGVVDARADQFSLGVILYELLTGALPYGAAVSRLRRPKDAARLRWRPLPDMFPGFVDAALARACHPDPFRRFDRMSEFVTALSTPEPLRPLPLAARHPERFWQGISLALGLLCVMLAWRLSLS